MAVVDRQLFANYTAVGTLASDPGASGPTLTLTTGHGARFPAVASGERLDLLAIDPLDTTVPPASAEIMFCTAHAANADTATVLRGQGGTSGVGHAAGQIVAAVETAEALRRFETNYGALPRHVGLKLWNYDAEEGASQYGFAQVTGSVVVSKVWVPEPMTLSNMFVICAAGGTGMTTGQNWCGACKPDGTLIAKTADQSTNWLGAFSSAMALTAEAGQSLDLAGGPGAWIYGMQLVNSTGTTPQFYRRYSASVFASNGVLSASDGYRAGYATAGAGGTLPSTLGTVTPYVHRPWMGFN